MAVGEKGRALIPLSIPQAVWQQVQLGRERSEQHIFVLLRCDTASDVTMKLRQSVLSDFVRFQPCVPLSVHS